MATCIDVAKTTYPEEWKDIDLEALVGKSLLPILQGKRRAGHDYLYFQFSSNRAIFKDQWKLVTHRASSWELFDIEKDGTELHDLAAKHPEVVKELSDLWHRTATNVDRLSGNNAKPVSGAKPPLLLKDGRPRPGPGKKKKKKSKQGN